MAYLLDANVFIQAKNLHYGMDFCPAFWDWLIANYTAKQVFSIEKVGDEILAVADELAVWASDRGPEFFLPPDNRLLAALSGVSTSATGQSYEPAAVNTFLQVADYYLVGHALAHGHIVVTHKIASTSTKRIKIPRRLYRLGYQVRNSLRDAADRTRTIHTRTEELIQRNESEQMNPGIS